MAKSAAAGQESRRQAVEVAAVDLRGLNIGVQRLWCCQWNWVVQNCPATNGVEERIPCESIPKCSSSMSHILRNTREAASLEAQRHTCKTLPWLAVSSLLREESEHNGGALRYRNRAAQRVWRAAGAFRSLLPPLNWKELLFSVNTAVWMKTTGIQKHGQYKTCTDSRLKPFFKHKKHNIINILGRKPLLFNA